MSTTTNNAAAAFNACRTAFTGGVNSTTPTTITATATQLLMLLAAVFPTPSTPVAFQLRFPSSVLCLSERTDAFSLNQCNEKKVKILTFRL